LDKMPPKSPSADPEVNTSEQLEQAEEGTASNTATAGKRGRKRKERDPQVNEHEEVKKQAIQHDAEEAEVDNDTEVLGQEEEARESTEGKSKGRGRPRKDGAPPGSKKSTSNDDEKRPRGRPRLDPAVKEARSKEKDESEKQGKRGRPKKTT
jgi:hypothetical protein